MSRLIDADALIAYIENEFDGVCCYDVTASGAVNDFQTMVYAQPTIEAVPVVHGGWIKVENTWVCSVCHKENACAYDEILHRYTDFFCPKCGAKMDDDLK